MQRYGNVKQNNVFLGVDTFIMLNTQLIDYRSLSKECWCLLELTIAIDGTTTETNTMHGSSLTYGLPCRLSKYLAHE